MTPLPVMPFTTEETTGCTTEAAKGANKAPRNLPSCFLVSYVTAPATLSINTSESSNDITILIISSKSSFEMDKVNPFLAVTAPFPLTFLSTLFIAFEAILLTNPGKLSLAKEIATFFSAFFALIT